MLARCQHLYQRSFYYSQDLFTIITQVATDKILDQQPSFFTEKCRLAKHFVAQTFSLRHFRAQTGKFVLQVATWVKIGDKFDEESQTKAY